MLCDLIIDGNFILSKNTFTLHKNNLLFGALYKSLENSITNYRRWYPFANIYLVSDSKEKSWRKRLFKEYKSQRKKDSDIDWEFVYNTYNDFKKMFSEKGVKTFELSQLEGDDWISYLVNKSNASGRSTIIVSNDYDIKQLLNWSINPSYINIMCNEIYNKQKIFLPKNYEIFLNELKNSSFDEDIFNLNDNDEFLRLISGFTEKYEISVSDSLESLLIKIISGDSSDNIRSVWSAQKGARRIGIGEKGAKSIIEKYIEEFGEVNLLDPDFADNISDLICEKKNLSKSNIKDISKNVIFNRRMVDLSLENIPEDLLFKMNNLYERI